MKKAFTLIELLAVIIIIALLATLSFRTISSVLNKIKQETYNQQVKNMEDSAKNYILDNDLSDLDGSSSIAISVNTLYSLGYLKNDINNPLTNQNFTGCVWVKKNINNVTIEIINTVEQTISLEYQYSDNCLINPF